MDIVRLTSIVALAVLSHTSLPAQEPKPAKNLLENGDFSAGTARWNGDGKSEVFKNGKAPAAAKTGSGLDALKPLAPPASGLPALPPLPVTPRPVLGANVEHKAPDEDRSCCIVLGSKVQKLTQRFAVPRTAKVLRATLRVRPSDDLKTERETLGAFQARLVYSDGASTYYDRKITVPSDWKSQTMQFTVPPNSRNMEWIIEVFPGTGRLYFDDIVIEGLDH